MIAEKSGPLWIGEDAVGELWGQMFSFRPSNFIRRPLPLTSPPAQRLDYILAGQRGGTWRLMDGRVQKWGPTQLEKDLGSYPWGNAIVNSACEDKNGNLIVGTLGAGVFWYGADGKYRQISTAQGLSSAYVLSLCMDQRGKSLGGHRWRRIGSDQKKNFQHAGRTPSVGSRNRCPETSTAVCGRLSTRMA